MPMVLLRQKFYLQICFQQFSNIVGSSQYITSKTFEKLNPYPLHSLNDSKCFLIFN